MPEPATIRLGLRALRPKTRWVIEEISILAKMQWERSPKTCRLVAPRFPLEKFLRLDYYARPDTERGYEVLNCYRPAWARDPKPEWQADSVSPGHFYYLSEVPGLSPNRTQRHVRFSFCTMTRGDCTGLSLGANVFATAADAAEVDVFAEKARRAHDRYKVDRSWPTLAMFIESVAA